MFGSIILVLLLGSAAAYLLEPYVKNAPIEWYTKRVLFSLRNGVTLLGVLLASIAFVSGNLEIRGQKVIGAFFLATTVLLAVALGCGYTVIRRPQRASNPKLDRILSSVCIAFVNVSTVYVAALILAFVVYYFYGV